MKEANEEDEREAMIINKSFLSQGTEVDLSENKLRVRIGIEDLEQFDWMETSRSQVQGKLSKFA